MVQDCCLVSAREPYWHFHLNKVLTYEGLLENKTASYQKYGHIYYKNIIKNYEFTKGSRDRPLL